MSYIYWQSLEQRGCLLSTPSQISPCALCHTPPRCKSSSSTFLQCPTCHTLSPLVPRTPAARPSGHVCFLQRPNRLSQQTPHTPASLFSSRESASNSPGTDLTPPGQTRHLTLYIHCLRHWRSPTATLQADTGGFLHFNPVPLSWRDLLGECRYMASLRVRVVMERAASSGPTEVAESVDNSRLHLRSTANCSELLRRTQRVSDLI